MSLENEKNFKNYPFKKKNLNGNITPKNYYNFKVTPKNMNYEKK